MIGYLTIGQSPRPDIVDEMRQLLAEAAGNFTGTNERRRVSSLRILEAGALDDLTRDEIAHLKPASGEDSLLTRLADGSSAVVGKSKLIPRLNSRIARLESLGTGLVALLCTEEFQGLRSHRSRLLLPCDQMVHTVTTCLSRCNLQGGDAPGPDASVSKLGVLAPLDEQRASMRRRWEKITGFHVVVDIAEPYSDWTHSDATPGALDTAARRFAEDDVALIVLDCFGYARSVEKRMAAITGKPVVGPRSLLAEWIVPLLGAAR